MDKLIELALSEKWDDVIKILKKESPIMVDDFLHTFFTEKKDAFFPYDGWTDEQENAFREMDSPEYRTRYYMAKGDANLTDREWADFKNCNI